MSEEYSQKEPDSTGTVDLVGHRVLGDIELIPQDLFTNTIMAATSEQGHWIEHFTSMIGPSRARFRSTYFHWAMAINGLHVAAEKYRSKEWKNPYKRFTITGIRPPVRNKV